MFIENLKARAVSVFRPEAERKNELLTCKKMIFRAACLGRPVNATLLERMIPSGIIPPQAVDYACQQDVELVYEV